MAQFFKAGDYFAPDALPIAVNAYDDVKPSCLHLHDFCELIVVLSGRGRLQADRRAYTISEGDVFVFQEQQEHSLQNARNMRLCSVLFDRTALPLPHEHLRRFPGYRAMFVLEPAQRHQHRLASAPPG